MDEHPLPLDPETFSSELLTVLDDSAGQRVLFGRLPPDQLQPAAAALKQLALAEMRRDAHKAAAVVTAMTRLGESAASPAVRALALQTRGILKTLADRDYEAALEAFAEAADLFAAAGDELGRAVTQVTRVWALACVQKYDEAFAAGAWASETMRRRDFHAGVAAINNNLAAIHGRRGEDHQALERLDDVLAAYAAQGEAGRARIPFAQINKSVVLRNLGRFDASISLNQEALARAETLGQRDTVARARQNLGITYFALGRMSEAQALLEEARTIFYEDGRYRDAILADLYITDGLLHLRQFERVIDKCRQVAEAFAAANTWLEVAQARLNEAIALAGLGRTAEATAAIAAARAIFAAEQNEAWSLFVDLEQANLFLKEARWAEAIPLLEETIPALRRLELPVKEAQGELLRGRALLELGDPAGAEKAAAAALRLARERDVPALAYQSNFLRGRIAEALGDWPAALAAYEAAIRQLERLQGQIMVEFRADFLVDKQEVYAAAVRLCIAAGNPAAALQLVERSRSRALLDLVTHRVDLRLEPHTPEDEPLVASLQALRESRNRLHRRWETQAYAAEEEISAGEPQKLQEAREKLRRQILDIEKEIKDSWHRLLIRSRAYAREAALWQITPDEPLPDVPAGAALIDFFLLGDEIVAFVLTPGGISHHPLPVTASEVGRLQQLLKHQLDTTQRAPHLAAALLPKGVHLLRQLHDGLIAPLWPALAGAERLIVVPYGPLHYLPWAALFDGERYLLEQFQVSVLPSLSLLGQGDGSAGEGALLMGHTQGGRLPHVAQELAAIAAHVGREPRLDEEATRRAFLEEAPAAGLIHIATHGEFRREEPLFSGLQLADGQLTTLDIFNTRLRASLVNLSACQTGRAVVGGGDELFGLLRAFLASGAASLLMSLWRVDDQSTAALMDAFYGHLAAGVGKGEALRRAQLALVRGPAATRHPYFWAPFFLVGDDGPLPEHLL